MIKMEKEKKKQKKKNQRNGLSPIVFFKVLKGILIQAVINWKTKLKYNYICPSQGGAVFTRNVVHNSTGTYTKENNICTFSILHNFKQ